MKTVIVILTLLIAKISADTITGCSSGQTCACVPGELCVFQCGESACEGDATLYCAPDEKCEIYCEAKDACKDSYIDCNGASSCFIDCQGETACSGNTVLDCGTSGTPDCDLICRSTDSCKDGDFVCGASDSCELNCGPIATACEDLNVYFDTPEDYDNFLCSQIASGVCGGDEGVNIWTEPRITEAPTTTTAPGDDDDDDDDDDDSDDDDDDDSDSIDILAAAKSIGDSLQDNTAANNGYTEQIVISFSKNAMINIWALVIGFLIVNVVIAWCYCFRSTKNTKVTFEDEISSKI